MTDRSTRRRGGLPRNSATDTTVATADPRPDQPPYERVDGGDVDLHRHFGGSPHAHADPPHWHDGDQTFPLHDYPAADDAAFYGTDPNPDNPPYERTQLDGPYPIPEHDLERDRTLARGGNEQAADRLAAAEAEPHTLGANGLPTDPAERDRLRAEFQSSLDYLNNTEPTRPNIPAIPAPATTTTRLGTVLGGLELVKASYRAMFPGSPDGIDQEWALTMAASDLIGQMLDHHRRPAFADPGLIADLRTIAGQLDQAAAARART